jgi:ABC-type polysaccharide/polyol phosphate export permease
MPKSAEVLTYDSSKPDLNFVRELMSFYDNRELIFLLVATELKSRYKRSILGLIWSLMNPILTSLVLWVVFFSSFKSQSNDGTEFAPYLLAGVITVTFFNQGLMQATELIANGTGIFLKIRVNPQLFVIANLIVNAMNFYLGVIALAFVSWVTHSQIQDTFLLVFLVGFLLLLMTMGLSLILANVYVRYRDSRFITVIILQLLTYLTPVFYTREILSDRVSTLISINPLTSFLDVFRNVFSGTVTVTTFDWAYMFISSILVFAIGLRVFKRNWPSTMVMM